MVVCQAVEFKHSNRGRRKHLFTFNNCQLIKKNGLKLYCEFVRCVLSNYLFYSLNLYLSYLCSTCHCSKHMFKSCAIRAFCMNVVWINWPSILLYFSTIYIRNMTLFSCMYFTYDICNSQGGVLAHHRNPENWFHAIE